MRRKAVFLLTVKRSQQCFLNDFGTPPRTSIDVRDVTFGFGYFPAVRGDVYKLPSATYPKSRTNRTFYRTARNFGKDSALRQIDVLVGSGNRDPETKFGSGRGNFANHAPLQLLFSGDIEISPQKIKRVEEFLFLHKNKLKN